MTSRFKSIEARSVLSLACLVIVAVYFLFNDLKGISTDEGIRLAIINGGRAFTLDQPANSPTWAMVLKSGSPYAYQPLYYLIQNTLMRVAQTHEAVFFRLVNIFFLWLTLRGLVALTAGWRLGPRLFLLGVFSFNAYLFMHVLQIREYILGVTFYVWSTWLVLRLDERPLGRLGSDLAWFAAYGVLLIGGFYVQTWVVFPAIGQCLFLVFRRRPALGRFLAYLALSYAITLAATLPYLQSHQQRVNVGTWGTAGIPLLPQLSDGFHLVLAGHLAGQSAFSDFLFWFWLAVIAAAAGLLLRRSAATAGEVAPNEFIRQGRLAVLCIAIPLAFQVAYFFKDTLSVWPRYFVVHYFFATWILALGFKYLDDLRHAQARANWVQRGLVAAVALIATVATASAGFQIRSYYTFPYLDTGFSRSDNWRTLSTALARIIRSDDIVIGHDFVIRSTLSFTRPLPNAFVVLPELEATPTQGAGRLVYLEAAFARSQRDDLVVRMKALGFPRMEEIRVPAADGKSLLNDWMVLAFTRP